MHFLRHILTEVRFYIQLMKTKTIPNNIPNRYKTPFYYPLHMWLLEE